MIPYQDSDLEKLYAFGRFPLAKLPRRESGRVAVDDEVGLHYYRLQLISEASIDLREGEAQPQYGPRAVGTGSADEGLRQAATANSLENFTPVFRKQLLSLFLQRMEGNEEIFAKVMNDDRFREAVAGYLVEVVYGELRGE